MVDAESPPWRRGRPFLVALVILLLILLPLYLWPLRGGGDVSGLPSASALPGSLRDPRSPVALAQIPGAVWDALMGRTGTPPPRPAAKAPPNLTMISEFEETMDGGLDLGAASPVSRSAASLAREMIAQLGSSDPSGDPSGDSPSTPLLWLASNPSGGPGIGFDPGGYPSFGGLGPFDGGGPGGRPPFTSEPTFDPGDPGAPTPTPEPATLVLVGSNLVLLGAAAWKRRRRRQETSPIV